jgi:ABC-type molybdate transport system permease subunit
MMNILLNAANAMGEIGGTLTIGTDLTAEVPKIASG